MCTVFLALGIMQSFVRSTFCLSRDSLHGSCTVQLCLCKVSSLSDQAGFRGGRNCVDHIYTLSQTTQHRIKEGLPTSFVMLLRPLTQFGVMGCFIGCGTQVFVVRCGVLLGTYITIHRAEFQ